MWKKLANYLDLAYSYFGFNLKAKLEYRGAFICQVTAMFVNDCIWLAYFVMVFDHYPVVPGWTSADVATLWAVTAAGFGIAHCLFGNTLELARIIALGGLDVWLLYPRALLPHLVLGKMSASSLGDALFGYAVYILFLRPDWQHLLLFTVLTMSVAVLFLGFSVLSGSLSFYLGNSETLSESWRNALIAFSTYPLDLFDGKVRLLLFTVIPAAFVSGYPVEALRKMSLVDAWYSLLGALLVLGLAIVVFHHGLRRYESGNMVAMRG
ncbi:MAG: ABC-2 family transporter protein [Candidatus Melainabacteria bacterium]|nr:ABC-2 family transporter protein [Candidatus Melainabacteria bacterium]